MNAQAERLFDNLHIALEALGGTWRHVVRIKTYLVDWRDQAAYDQVIARHLGEVHPGAATVGTWGFPLPQILLETELVACLDQDQHRADRLHYCTAGPVDARAEVAGHGDARGQAEHALRNLAATLERTGLSLRDVVMLEVSLADLRTLPAFDEVCAKFFRAPYPARSVVGVPLARAGQLVELEATAARGGGEAVEPGGGFAAPTMASSGMRAGDWLFASARTGGDQGSVERQTRLAWEGIAATMDAAGMALEDVVRTNNILTDWRLYAEFNAGYGSFVSRPFPPRATVQATLADPRAYIQVQAIAHRMGRDATVLEAAAVADAARS